MSASALYLLAVVTCYITAALLLVVLPGPIDMRVGAIVTVACLAAVAISRLTRARSRDVVIAATSCCVALCILSGSLISCLVTAWTISVAHELGRFALRRVDLARRLNALERSTIAVAVGLALLSYGMLGLGLVGGLTPVIGVALAVVSVALAPKALRDARALARAIGDSGRAPASGLLVVFAAFAVLLFAQSIAPEVQYDALSYHLGLPREYIAAGRIIDIPEQPQSFQYLGAEMNFTLAMLLGGQTSAKLLSLAFLGLGALAVYEFARVRLSGSTARLAAVLYAVTPAVAWQATTTYVDHFVAAYGFITAVTVYRAVSDRDRSLAALGGVLAGIAITTKLTAFIVILPIAAALLIGWRDRRAMILFCVAGLITAVPWPILRFVQTGNPVFPLVNDVFRSSLWPYVGDPYDPPRYVMTGPAMLLLPFAITFDASRFVQAMSGPVIGVGVLVAPLAFAIRRSRAAVFMTAIGLATVLVWAVTAQYLRYLLPAIPFLSLATAVVLDHLNEGLRGRPLSQVVRAVPIAMAIASVALWLGTYRGLVPEILSWRVATGIETRDAYLRRSLPAYAALRSIDDSQPSRVILASCFSGSDDEDRLYAPDHVETCESVWLRQLYEVTDADATRSALALRDVTHVLVNERGVRPNMRASALLAPGFLEQHGDVIYDDGAVRLYKLVPSGMPR